MFGRRKKDTVPTTVPTTRFKTDYKSSKQIESSSLPNNRVVEQNKSFANISNRPLHLFQSGDERTTNSPLNTTTVPSADPVKGVRATEESNGLTTQMAIILGLGLSLVFVLIICLILFAVSRTLSKKRDKKDKKRGQKDGGGGKHESEDTESQSGIVKQNSLIRDLPSTDVQSILIDNKELKPVKSEVFKWKSTVKPSPRKDNNKKPKNKDKPKEQLKDKQKEKKAINRDKFAKKDKKGRNEKKKGKDGKANKN